MSYGKKKITSSLPTTETTGAVPVSTGVELETRAPSSSVKYSDRDLKIGFQRINSRQVLDIPECLLATKAVNEQYRRYREEAINTHEQNGDLLFTKKKKLLSSVLFRDDMNGTVESNPNAYIAQQVNGLHFTYKAGMYAFECTHI